MLAAVIVTYNRKELLCRNVEMLLQQTIRFDKIFIIDNCSSDGTAEYLSNQGWLSTDQFVYIRLESNIGGAGGFSVGTKVAYEAGADWTILMDDDGWANDPETFKILMERAESLRSEGKGDGKLFVNALVQCGDYLSFKIRNMYLVSEVLESAENGIISGEANPFNGTAVSRELISEIGFPNKDFFIKGDEVDYKQRAAAAGAYVCTVVDSRYNHPRPETIEKKVMGVSVPFVVEAPWKEYYTARNLTYMYKRSKKYKAILFEVIYVKLLAIFSANCNRTKTMHMLFKGVRHGWNGKLGPIIKP